ncbi:cation transporter [Crenalkalicoccus roseus]|uniref:cation transporter n=1 Tax=Crenalkalicoccus roseus TaxID=1485588 RepID=UPI003084507B
MWRRWRRRRAPSPPSPPRCVTWPSTATATSGPTAPSSTSWKDAMATVALKVEGMSCQHCVRAITAAIRERDPAAEVRVDLAAGTVHAETSLPREAVAAAVAAEGYTVAG